MFGILKKFNSKDIKSSYYFIVLALIFAISFLLLFLGHYKSYRTEITILLIPKSAQAIMQSEQIMENLAELPRQLSFYDRVLASNKIADPYAGRTQEQRKKEWNNSLTIKRSGKGTIFTLGIFANKRSDSLNTAKLTVNTLFSTASRYYDIKRDIDLRVIDGPISNSFMDYFFGFILLSLILGLIAAYLINRVCQTFFGFVIGVKQKITQAKKVPISGRFTFHRSATEKKTNFVATREASVKQYGAPANLPIATGEYPFVQGLMEQKSSAEANIDQEIIPESMQAVKTASSENTEPTEEDLKRRLNQLIKGNF